MKLNNLFGVICADDVRGYEWKLGDFGISTRPDNGEEFGTLSGGLGATGLRAPEVAAGGVGGSAQDMYAVGLACLQIWLRVSVADLAVLEKDPYAPTSA